MTQQTIANTDFGNIVAKLNNNFGELYTAVASANSTALAANTGATLIGTSTGDDVQEVLDSKASAALVGVANGAVNMGTYTGSTISDNQTAKQNIQEIETAVEARVSTAALAAASGVFLVGNAIQYRSSRANLAAQTNTSLPALLTESGREGTFVWSSANNSANVTADPQQGVYIAPASDTTGASGAWVRRYFGVLNVKWFGATGDGITSDQVACQHAIDFVGFLGGGIVHFPPGVYMVAGLRQDGSGGGKTNITLEGSGPASHIKLIAGETGNVIRTAGGAGFKVKGLKVEGNLSRGGAIVQAPNRGFWVTGASYVIGDKVEVSSGDTATTTVAAGNIVYECTANHVAGATFLDDKATKWTLVASPNFNTVDISYGTRNGIYLDGVTDSEVEGCTLVDCVYAGVNVGTGPVQAANAGPGSSYVKVHNNHFIDGTNAIAGGKQTYCSFAENTITGCDVYGIVVDDPASSGNTVTGNTIAGCGSHGIYLYGCDISAVTGNTVSFCGGVGILLDNAALGNPVTGNAVTNCLQGIRAYNSAVALISGNVCRANTQYGIAVDTMSQFELSGNLTEANGYDGIRLTNCSAFSLDGNSGFANVGEGGIYITGCANGTVSGGCQLDNNNSGTPSADGAGVLIINSTSVTVMSVTAYDSRAGGSKTQKYGVRATGTSNVIKLGGCQLAGNATADFSLAGANSRVVPDVAKSIAAGTPANFTADRYVTFVEADGTTLYLPARLGPW